MLGGAREKCQRPERKAQVGGWKGNPRNGSIDSVFEGCSSKLHPYISVPELAPRSLRARFQQHPHRPWPACCSSSRVRVGPASRPLQLLVPPPGGPFPQHLHGRSLGLDAIPWRHLPRPSGSLPSLLPSLFTCFIFLHCTSLYLPFGGGFPGLFISLSPSLSLDCPGHLEGGGTSSCSGPGTSRTLSQYSLNNCCSSTFSMSK